MIPDSGFRIWDLEFGIWNFLNLGLFLNYNNEDGNTRKTCEKRLE